MTTPAAPTRRADGRWGEVVEAAIDRLTAQSHVLYDAPPLGTLVRAGGPSSAVFSVVSGVATLPLDPTRPVIAHGADAGSEAEVYREHPQLAELLRTRVTLSVVAHRHDALVHPYLPPLPPRIHTFVYTAVPEDVRAVFASPDFVRLLLATAGPTADEVLTAALRQAAPAFDRPREFLRTAGRAVGAVLAADAGRLSAIVRRLPISDSAHET